MSIQTTNPATNKVVKSFNEMTDEQIEAALQKSNNTFQEWKKTSYGDRAKLLRKVASLMRKRKSDLAKLITLEMGKIISQAEWEIDLSADILDYYADNGAEFLADKKLNPESGEAFIRSSAIGVLFGVMPWNFPFYQVVRFAAPNIMVGNTILLKHASIVPQCAIAIEDLFTEAKAPEGLYINLLISGKRSTALVSDQRIKGVSLTGSEGAGSSIAEAAGKHLKNSVLELGGSDAFIVLEDADIDTAVEMAIAGRMNNNGQSCIASKRFIAVASIADEFLEKFTKKVAALKVGDPMDPNTQVGPLSSEEALVNILEQVKRFEKAGAKILVGGKRASDAGAFMQPTILTNLKRGVPTFQEELFGPVASFYKVENEEEAIDLANDSPFGLGGSIYTKDIKRAVKIADKIDSGMIFINHPTSTQPDLPFGGTKGSGYGRELSELGISEFVNKKLIRVI
ncbi:succinate-semialdehyde dehydrogenase/glutarate-semialdehyde dehydrogenase [Flavobacterium sp. CG_23.5]|uniref:NAD-dependent succinate-semialdehyde dehydrogenase n=1 Tax=unclassified Flavobacterium TaxID=196869 RepID=UPI0018C911FD|nr:MULTISPECIES: NAD-dependent succinate-semialdehyde dehydrogenase [unclassified Flavobacterium]MBG6111634.1 succinate-semialdehyde dehydrogenase/glutarate-semialdehyde dehydrogenase [Flavobacterium sp. CG_9.10]MBP2282271.1 succinate-semialdehyde dehydrogenase/glutarate-semialdehyde dehydrogenase [Flavobacterium sp. CG_23.5]